MIHEALFEVYHPAEQRWQAVMPGYVNAFLRAGPGDVGALLARLNAGETLEFNGWRLRRRGATQDPAPATDQKVGPSARELVC